MRSGLNGFLRGSGFVSRENEMKTTDGKPAGKSLRAVYEYVETCGHPCDSTEVGLALYDKTSSCAGVEDTFWSKDQIRRRWAEKLLNGLVRKGYLRRVRKGYFDVEKGVLFSPRNLGSSGVKGVQKGVGKFDSRGPMPIYSISDEREK